MTWIIFFNMSYLAHDGWRQESYSETVEAVDEETARLVAGELIVSSLSAGETAEITEVSHAA